jgi:hypothetical protein
VRIVIKKYRDASKRLRPSLFVSTSVLPMFFLIVRQNLNSSHQITNGSPEFIGVTKHVLPDFRVPAPLEAVALHTCPTLPLLDPVQGALHKTDHGDAKPVILDDIATLEWIRFLMLAVSRFARPLRGCVFEGSSSLYSLLAVSLDPLRFRMDDA